MPTSRPAPLPRAAPIIVLNGASSSGKTTLARAMQSIWNAPLHHLQHQLDAFRAMEPPRYWDDWQRLDQPSVERMLGGLCSAMHAAMREYSKHGLQVVFDTALTNPAARRRLIDDLVDVPVYLVGVHCSLPELVRRESVRGDKRSGLAASQADGIHRHMLYDYEVDTTERKPDEAACDLARWFFEGPAPSAFNRLKAPVNAA